MIKKYAVFITFLISFFINAQSVSEFRERFDNSMNYYKSTAYEAAMAGFFPLTVEHKHNSNYIWASYFYARSAMALKDWDKSSEILQLMINKYSHFEQIEEVYFLLAQVYFEQKEFKKALEELKNCTSESIKVASRNLKLHYLYPQKDVVFLKNLYYSFRDDKEVGTVLAHQLTHSSEKEDIEILELLNLKYNLNLPVNYPEVKLDKKKVYKIAALLPLKLASLNDTKTNDNQYVFEFIQGLQMAVDSLNSIQNSINLLLYDVDKDTSKIGEILRYPELADVDMIVGPNYVTNFAIQKKIILLNPFGGYGPKTKKEFIYYLRTFSESQEVELATFSKKTFPLAKAIILFGSNLKDSVSAFNYQSELIKQGVEIVLMQKVNKTSSFKLKEILTNDLIDNIGHVYVAFSEQMVATNFMTSLEIIDAQIPIITSSEWFNYQSIAWSQYSNHNFYFINPSYYNYNSTQFKNFNFSYFSKYNTFSTNFVLQGYDTGLIFGKALLDYGIKCDSILRTGFINGITLAGFDFSKSCDNRFFPITKLINNQNSIVNNPLVPYIETYSHEPSEK